MMQNNAFHSNAPARCARSAPVNAGVINTCVICYLNSLQFLNPDCDMLFIYGSQPTPKGGHSFTLSAFLVSYYHQTITREIAGYRYRTPDNAR